LYAPTLFFRDPSCGRTVPRRRAETDKMDGPVLVSTGKLSDDPQTLESLTTSDASYNHSLSLKALYRKLDRRIIPCLWILYFLASSSRSNVGLALTMNTATGDGLSQQLGLNGHQISTGVALFYVGYVIFEIPSNLVSMFSFQSPVPLCGEGLIVVTRIRPHVWIARIQMSIGIVAACHAALRSEWSFYLLRFLLGACEAGVWPGISPPIGDSHIRNGILFDSMVSSQQNCSQDRMVLHRRSALRRSRRSRLRRFPENEPRRRSPWIRMVFSSETFILTSGCSLSTGL